MSSLATDQRRRRDVKTQDREKSMSPLDKDDLKRRCLERLRAERGRLFERNRGRQGCPVMDLSACTIDKTGSEEDHGSHKSSFSLSTPREILRHELQDMSESRRHGTRHGIPARDKFAACPGSTSAQFNDDEQRGSPGSEIPEEGAYRRAQRERRLPGGVGARKKVSDFVSSTNPGGENRRLQRCTHHWIVEILPQCFASSPSGYQICNVEVVFVGCVDCHEVSTREHSIGLSVCCRATVRSRQRRGDDGHGGRRRILLGR